MPALPAPVLPAAPLRAPSLQPIVPLLPGVQAAPRTLFVPALPSAGPVVPKASSEELAFAAGAAAQLALAADDIGEERGLKSSRMTGKDFLDMLEAGRARWLSRTAAPTPEAARAAAGVQESILRIAKALLKEEEPLQGQVRRLLAVWDVFNQEMALAADKGTLEAVEADARLFAEQVERSV